jgi:N,N'-diacetyllegionaminate synthase
LDIHEFRDLVSKIRRLERALGDGMKRCTHSEENVKEVARKSIVARRAVDMGRIITSDDLAIKRPGVGIPPKYLSMIIGAKAKESISADKLIKWSQLDLQSK